MNIFDNTLQQLKTMSSKLQITISTLRVLHISRNVPHTREVVKLQPIIYTVILKTNNSF